MNYEILALTIDLITKQLGHFSDIKKAEGTEEEKQAANAAAAAAILYGLETAGLVPDMTPEEREQATLLVAKIAEVLA
ncbi:hypothetical protein [Paenibacillus durus]|uniref:Uncharacterized protein n=1 Tax=Paenibacillus durus ATCC 35681 TaxID=1333534 RepID=A0A0F7CIV7_PAEDU|nr:hypothetical protein [Paenibacillus durus]AKG35641.1 hypothetical protein VK70_14535 [Paenibacillus durus ATCC 35681]